MDTNLIVRHFARIGARALVRVQAPVRRESGVVIDVRRDREGEFFDLDIASGLTLEVSVVDIRPDLRHLLLMSRVGNDRHKFLCGHDERHWFVAAVPEREAASSVQTAFEALKPAAVRQRQDLLRVKPRKRNRRRNGAFIRQGEWFFVPASASFQPNAKLMLRNEPISRGRGKPHYCEELVRTGGELVYVSIRHPQGLTEEEYRQLIRNEPRLRSLHWIAQRRNPEVFVRGKVRHADHKTIILIGWHQVLMNTETQAAAMRHVAFID
ncbi:MAG TPA: hypothetical protein VFB96_13410 [Pirellulaceae bacterium]|nr:hypothetical protein [Pirellulaceae bacterium]